MKSNNWTDYVQINCRTCAHSTAMPDSTWRCERHEADNIPEDFQHEGCDDHVIHPDLVPWPMTPSEDGLSVTWDIDGRQVVNGPGGYTSKEILTNPEACETPFVQTVRAAFPGARVVG